MYYRNTLTTGIADRSFFWGDPADRVFSGDWDGDGDDTPGLFRPSNTTFYLRNSNTQGIADESFVFGGPSSTFRPISGHWGLG